MTQSFKKCFRNDLPAKAGAAAGVLFITKLNARLRQTQPHKNYPLFGDKRRQFPKSAYNPRHFINRVIHFLLRVVPA